MLSAIRTSTPKKRKPGSPQLWLVVRITFEAPGAGMSSAAVTSVCDGKGLPSSKKAGMVVALLASVFPSASCASRKICSPLQSIVDVPPSIWKCEIGG
jgi:hypothetical protein